MVEHVNIADADRHEPKGASTAATNQVVHANGNGTTTWKFVDYNSLVNKPQVEGFQQVLVGFSPSAQNPAAVDTPLQVSFGGAQATAHVTLDASGTLTFLTAGKYTITLFLRFGRTTAGGQAVLLNRFLVNDVQGLNSNGLILPDNSITVPFSTTLHLDTQAGTTFKMQIMRDSTGVNNGGLLPITPTVPAWNIVPSATIIVNRFVGLT